MKDENLKMCDFRRSFGSFGAPKEQVKIESQVCNFS